MVRAVMHFLFYKFPFEKFDCEGKKRDQGSAGGRWEISEVSFFKERKMETCLNTMGMT